MYGVHGNRILGIPQKMRYYLIFLVSAILAIKTKETGKIIPFIIIPLCFIYWHKAKYFLIFSVFLIWIMFPTSFSKDAELKFGWENVKWAASEIVRALIPFNLARDLTTSDRIGI